MLVRLREFAERWPENGSEASLRFEIFNAATNGLDDVGAIVRKGRSVYINEARYFQWAGLSTEEYYRDAEMKERAALQLKAG